MSEYTYTIRFRPGRRYLSWEVNVYRDGHRLGGSAWTELAKSERQAKRYARKIIRLDRKHHGKVYR